MLDMLIYTQGLVSMIIAGGLSIDKDAAHKMLEEMSRVCILPFTTNKE